MNPLRQLVAAIALYLLWAATAQAETRVALLVGNSDYPGTALDLENPANDVAALGAALEEIGFDVLTVIDSDAAHMRTSLSRFGALARGADIALFFYAGHGIRFGGDNLLIGTGFSLTEPGRVVPQSLAMGEVRRTLERAEPGAGLILLDACRDTPFGEGGRTGRGLVRTSGGAGLLIAYATDPGNVAYDGAGENSVFTSALLKHIATPALDVRLMLGRVRQEVVLETFGQQVPWVEEALIGEHVLVPGEAEMVDDPLAEEMAAWRLAEETGTLEAMRTFLADYPAGVFAQAARARLEASGRREGLPAASDPAITTEDPVRLASALAVLGLIDTPAPPPSPAELHAAVDRFRGETGNDGGPEALYRAAADRALRVAAAAAQQIRTDLIALRSVDRLLGLSRQALSEIAEIATRNADALPVLEQARRDLGDIERSRRRILRRLDQSRTTYGDLVTLTAKFLPRDFAADASGDAFGAIGEKYRDDARLFLDHVRDADPEREGSYAWLADFLRRG